MKQHLLAIIAALAAIILALFSFETDHSGSRLGCQGHTGTRYIASAGADVPVTENVVMPVVETFHETSLPEETVHIVVYDEPTLPTETRHAVSLHYTAMTALSPAEVPPLDAGMVNVTGNSEFRIQNSESDNGIRTAGYRMQFPVTNSGFQVTIPYDPALLPQGFTEDDIQTYVYDRQYRRWVAIERDSVNEVELLVYSRFSRNPVVWANDYSPIQTPSMDVTDMMRQAGEGGGDSPLDFINAVLKTPEMPETSAYTPTSIKELKAADPLEGLTLMQPPTANNSGTANLSYPIEIPAGRQGMQPILALTYSSGGGNGWLGVGWDIPIPSITVETRWGVPRYNQDKESEVYLYEGEQLVTKKPNGEFREMPHRTNQWTDRHDLDQDGHEQFFPRKNEAFDSIVRHGDGPGNYWWSVTHRNGVTDYYGKYASDNGVNNNCVLRKMDNVKANNTGPIAYWALAESVDPDGNSVRYYYDIAYSKGVSDGSWGKQIYVDSISYTCFNSTNPTLEESGKYSVKFQRKGTGRKDVVTILNHGLKEVTADVLCHLDVRFQDSLFRQYVFVTRNDSTTKYKTVLTDIVRIDSPAVHIDCDNVLALGFEVWGTIQGAEKLKTYASRCHLDYYGYPSADSLYSPAVTVNGLPNDDIHINAVRNTFRSTALGATKTKSWSLGSTGAVGIGVDICTTTATLGANVSYSNSKSEGMMTLVDLDGDGLADKLFKKNGILYCRRQVFSPDTPFVFESTAHPIDSVADFLKESSNSVSIGLQASCIANISQGLPMGWSSTSNYMTDINGDGLVDVVTERGAFFGTHFPNGVPAFSSLNTIQTTVPGPDSTGIGYNVSSMSLGTGGCGGIIFDGEVDPDIACVPDGFDYVIPRSDTIPSSFFEDSCTAQIIGYEAGDLMVVRKLRPKFDCGQTVLSPQFDAVRVWIAPYNDTILMISSISLLPNDTALFRQNRYANGVYCSIEHNKNCHIGTDNRLVTDLPPDNVLSREITRPDSVMTDTVPIVVSEDDILLFRLQSMEDRSFDKVNWTVRICAKDHAGQGNDIYARDKGVFNSDSDFVLTGKNMFQAPQNGQVWISGVLKYAGSHGDSARLVIKRRNTIEDLQVLSPGDSVLKSISFQVDSLDTVIVRIERTSSDGNPQWPNIHFMPLLKYYPSDTMYIKDTVCCYPQISMDIKHDSQETPFRKLCRKFFGELYRGWGQFAYNPKGANTTYINLSKLELPEWYTAESLGDIDTSVFSTPVDTNDLGNSLTNAVGLVQNPLSTTVNWIEMTAYNDLGVYRGTGLNTAVAASYMDNSEPKLSLPVSDSLPGSLSYNGTEVELETIPLYDHPVPVSISGEPVQTIRKRHWNIGVDQSVGVDAMIASLGFSSSAGGAYIQSDYMDLNGDRYPDPVSTNGVQYTMPWGGIGILHPIVFPESDHLSASNSFSHGQSQGRCYPDPRKLPSNNPKSGKTSLTGSGTLSHNEVSNEDATDYMLMDVNGDGLPDMVNTSKKTVCLNAGYGFLNAETWDVDYIREGSSSNQSGSVGFGGDWEPPTLPANAFSLAQVSISGGTGRGTSYNKTTRQMMDVNGDGLPDKVQFSGNGIKVRYSLGNGQWSSEDSIGGVCISANRSASEDVNLGVTVGFTACAVVKVNMGIQTSPFNRSLATDVAQLTDIDGDGYPDYITSDSETSVTIRHNWAGKTNLLRKVTNFTGSTIEMDYELSEPCYEKPQRSWNLVRVETHNNVDTCPVGGNRTLTTFSYGNPHYDRYERMEFGYDTVRAIVHNTDSLDAPYRQNVTVYNNVNLAKRGRKVMEAVLDGIGTKYVVKHYESVLKDFVGDTVDQATCNLEGIYVGHVAETTVYYEGTGNDSIVVAVSKDYDRYRNITRYTYEGIVGNGIAQRFTARVSYKQGTEHNLVSLPETVVVFNHDSSEIFQSRTAVYDANGHLQSLTKHNGSQDAVWQFSYDNYGNMVWAQMPANANSQRLEFTYDYDPVLNTYPVTVTNTSLGFSSTAEYGYLYGKPTKTTDVNGNEMWYEYDALGRTVRITAPYEQENQNPYTIKMEYHPHNYSDADISHNWQNPYSYAITNHYDSEHPGNDILTTVISDGWGRMLQTKKDAEINGQEMSIVTGKVEYDCFGRTVAQYHPFTEAATSAARPFYNPQTESGTETVTRYDIMDRPVYAKDPMDHVTHMAYGFGSDSGRRYFRTTTVDANDNAVTVLKDGLGLQVLTAAPMSSVTRFEYDAIGQLRKSTDPDGFKTWYWYDMFGRLIHRQHPDAGDDFYNYDPSGNLVSHVNAASEHIDYTYHYNQLTDITYSQYPECNVHYEYGTVSDASCNAVGKVIFLEDGSGWQMFYYGKLGEVTDNIRTFALPFDNHVYTFRMSYRYDSWNRIQTMIYPDGEIVNYYYNKGGLLDYVSGDKDSEHFEYIHHISYNKFELKDTVQYGNGTVTFYQYDTLLRLSNLISQTSAGEIMQDIAYDYDAVGNILYIENSAGTLHNGLGGAYSNLYKYDDLYRLIYSHGNWLGYPNSEYDLQMDYFLNGRVSRKTLSDTVVVQTPMTSFFHPIAYDNYYYYANTSQPNTLTSIGDITQQNFAWDAKGNMVIHEPMGRHFCWNEQNRLLGVNDVGQRFTYYQYDANGDRTFKFTGQFTSQNVSGNWYNYYYLDNPTLYVSPYLVVTSQGYTKHYYAENERIASKIGGGGLQSLALGMERYPEICKMHQEYADHQLINVAQCIDVTIQPSENVLLELYLWLGTRDAEKDCYWYHPDHLGSSSWITYSDGSAVQHLHYLPWGEDFVNQQQTDWGARYTFSAKEKDVETGLSYFGSRYYSSDLSIWLSVDPMAAKYASLSPYTYCANNPVKLVDPNGDTVIAYDHFSKRMIRSYMKEIFGKNNLFRFSGYTLTINERLYRRYYQSTSDDRRKLLDGFRDIITRPEKVIVQIVENKSFFVFEKSEAVRDKDGVVIGGRLTGEYTTLPNKGGGVSAWGKHFSSYLLGVDNSVRDNLSTDEGGLTGNPAATFTHELLDEVLNHYIHKTVNENSSKLERVASQNAALRTMNCKQRNGNDHE